jgi:endonuclease/exonuclease/phosphatase family metal-dependent hydrolase
LGNRSGQFFKTQTHNIFHDDIQFRSLPTVTDTTFEIAIGRNVRPNTVDLLFTSQTIKIFFSDNVTNGDWMPNSSETFEYTFDDTPTPPVDLIEINKEDTTLLRVMNWNILDDGLTNISKQQYFTRILQAIDPDVICFSECVNSTASQVKDKLNEILPLASPPGWYAMKMTFDEVVASRYPILQGWTYDPDERSFASLIDLPEYFGTDILTINAHLKCCGGQANDDQRQREVDAIISFILDAKTAGGSVDLPVNTPFLIMGDLNLVGDREQLTTLVTGQIINTQTFGSGGPPDWDNTDLEDLISQQTDKRTAYTWRDDFSFYPPGRLDFQIYSNSVMTVQKAFTLQTEIMSPARLSQYNLQQTDTRLASDHFPKVTDYSFNVTSIEKEDFQPFEFKLEQNYPNPFNPTTNIKFTIPSRGMVKISVYNILGKLIEVLVNRELNAGSNSTEFDGTDLPSGIYFYELITDNLFETRKMILLK